MTALSGGQEWLSGGGGDDNAIAGLSLLHQAHHTVPLFTHLLYFLCTLINGKGHRQPVVKKYNSLNIKIS